jgi:hypothetical protein
MQAEVRLLIVSSGAPKPTEVLYLSKLESANR